MEMIVFLFRGSTNGRVGVPISIELARHWGTSKGREETNREALVPHLGRVPSSIGKPGEYNAR